MNTLQLFQLLAVISVLYRLKRSVLRPIRWESPNRLPSLEGVLEPNHYLSKENVHQITGDAFLGPESTAIDPETNIVYASFNDGTIRSFQGDDAEFKLINSHLFSTGAYVLGHTGEELTKSLINWCHEQIAKGNIPWTSDAEMKCGRPQGLRIRKEGDEKFLYIIDTYHGIFKLNLRTQDAIHLLNGSFPIYQIEDTDNHLHFPIRFFNDLDILENGEIVFTDSSYRYYHSENRHEVIDGGPRGRLFLYKPQTKQLHVKLCGLHFANGVQILQNNNKREVIVTDSARFRLLKVNLDANFLEGKSSLWMWASDEHITAFTSCGEKGSLYVMLHENHYEATGVTIFTDSLPGFPDNLRFDVTSKQEGKNYYFVAMATISSKPFSILWSIYQYPTFIRDFVGKFIPIRWIEKVASRYGLIVVVDEEGKIVASLHDPKGQGTTAISQAERHPKTGDIWIGSHSVDKLVVVKKKNLPMYWEE